ncbi:MAG: DJ-1/PfpI family protein [Bacteroidales bacterium]|nr:DJ-1/PfpI family protein [Bacteroidales bacterium]
MIKSTKFVIVLLAVLTFSIGCTPKKTENNQTTVREDKIKVGIFNRNGDSPFCIIDAEEALRIDEEIETEVIGAAVIMSERINEFDVLLFPGGGGKSETNSLGELGMQRVRDFVQKDGKGVLGICAGAYILSDTKNYPDLMLSGATAIDLENDHRGNGLVKFSLTKEGKEIFPELKDYEIAYCQYYEGPVTIPSENKEIAYTELATMLSDVHLIEGTPENMTNNRPFIHMNENEQGRTASFIGHPETTPGMRWMIPRMVRWVSKNELVSYNDKVVRPGIHKNEILFDAELRAEQSKLLYTDLFGSSEEKNHAIKRLVEINAWSARKKIPGLLRDSDKDVRLTAAKACVALERTDVIYDLEIAIQNEPDPIVKAEMKKLVQQLQEMI